MCCWPTDLYPSQLPADEPEPPELVTWPLERLDELLISDDFREARAIAALYLVAKHLEHRDVAAAPNPSN